MFQSKPPPPVLWLAPNKGKKLSTLSFHLVLLRLPILLLHGHLFSLKNLSFLWDWDPFFGSDCCELLFYIEGTTCPWGYWVSSVLYSILDLPQPILKNYRTSCSPSSCTPLSEGQQKGTMVLACCLLSCEVGGGPGCHKPSLILSWSWHFLKIYPQTTKSKPVLKTIFLTGKYLFMQLACLLHAKQTPEISVWERGCSAHSVWEE